MCKRCPWRSHGGGIISGFLTAELGRLHLRKEEGVSGATWASVKAKYSASHHESKTEQTLERPWKLLSCFSWEPGNSLAMHTLPIVRDIDRAVRGTPSSIVGENRRKWEWDSGWGPKGHRQTEITPNYPCFIAGFAGMAQSSEHQGSFIVWCFLLAESHLPGGLF